MRCTVGSTPAWPIDARAVSGIKSHTPSWMLGVCKDVYMKCNLVPFAVKYSAFLIV